MRAQQNVKVNNKKVKGHEATFLSLAAFVTQGYALAVGERENELLMPPHAVQLESTSFRLSWSLWGDGVKRQRPPFPELVAC